MAAAEKGQNSHRNMGHMMACRTTHRVPGAIYCLSGALILSCFLSGRGFASDASPQPGPRGAPSFFAAISPYFTSHVRDLRETRGNPLRMAQTLLRLAYPDPIEPVSRKNIAAALMLKRALIDPQDFSAIEKHLTDEPELLAELTNLRRSIKQNPKSRALFQQTFQPLEDALASHESLNAIPEALDMFFNGSRTKAGLFPTIVIVDRDLDWGSEIIFPADARLKLHQAVEKGAASLSEVVPSPTNGLSASAPGSASASEAPGSFAARFWEKWKAWGADESPSATAIVTGKSPITLLRWILGGIIGFGLAWLFTPVTLQMLKGEILHVFTFGMALGGIFGLSLHEWGHSLGGKLAGAKVTWGFSGNFSRHEAKTFAQEISFLVGGPLMNILLGAIALWSLPHTSFLSRAFMLGFAYFNLGVGIGILVPISSKLGGGKILRLVVERLGSKNRPGSAK